MRSKSFFRIIAAFSLLAVSGLHPSLGQETAIPAVHQGISRAEAGDLMYTDSDGNRLPQVREAAAYTLAQMRAMPKGSDTGLEFDFHNATLNGRLYYGFIPSAAEVKHPYPIYFSRYAEIDSGRAQIDIRNRLVGKYDLADWQKTGIIRLGYRVAAADGRVLYDGKLMIKGTGPFQVDTSIIEGPFINLVSHTGAVVSFETNFPIRCQLTAAGQVIAETRASTHHEIDLADLQPNTEYTYAVICGDHRESYSFRTAPEPGARLPFTFAYASDGRGNQGGGERDIWGVNGYILKRIAVLCAARGVRFFQFTGDLVDGYTIDEGDILLQYANWKRAVEPFAHYLPFVAGYGNHENHLLYFSDGSRGVGIDKFPFETVSSEAIFAANFVNPTNGPASEDGSRYDPNPDWIDFPSYKENVFYYTYDNVAIIVLNSNYWFSYSIARTPEIGGNLHGYIMDNQLDWLKETLALLEADTNVDHIFVTIHTPIFPNGGHVRDDMWYGGNNDPRPYIAGEPVGKGIIERRDEFLDLMMNHSSKVKACLTGDEHNYSLLRVTADMPMYPAEWSRRRLSNIRPFWHINNGAAGAPYYGREETPWSEQVQSFSTQNALVLFHVNGAQVTVEVVNPDTMEKIDEFRL